MAKKMHFKWGRENLQKLGRALIPKYWQVVLKNYIQTAGLEDVPYAFFGFIFNLSLLMSILVYIDPRTGILPLMEEMNIFFFIGLSILVFAGVALLIIAALMVSLKMYLDLVIYRRKKNVEEFLPDLLQQASANIRAGMTIDKALWFAVRPNYGILADEIEIVAKKTLGGVEFTQALREMAARYDSNTLKRAVNLLINGLEAGGEIGNLLTKISVNIQENKLMQKELAANLKTYAIFISFATLVAAPLLFALSSQLLAVVQKIGSSMSMPSGVSGFGLMINVGDASISLEDFNYFAILSLTITSFFSSTIVAIIQKGTIKDSLRSIPVFIIVAIVIYKLVGMGIGDLLAGLV